MSESFVPPDNVAKAAAKGLEMRAEFGRGGTMVGVARAKQLKNKQEISARTIGRMVSYFARHEVDKKGKGFYAGSEGYPSAGRIAWELWGGDAGKAWAEKSARAIERKEENMTDVKVLTGSPVRRADGAKGRVKAVSLPWVTVEWTTGQYESFKRSDDRLGDLEIKTINEGWVPLNTLVGINEAEEIEENEEGEDINSILSSLRLLGRKLANPAAAMKQEEVYEARRESAAQLLDEKRQNPYNNRNNRGDKPESVPGFRSKAKSKDPKSNNFYGVKGLTQMPQKNKWDCTNSGKYTAVCTNTETGEKKTVNIDPAYKKAYNRTYRQAEKSGKTNSVQGLKNRKHLKKKKNMRDAQTRRERKAARRAGLRPAAIKRKK